MVKIAVVGAGAPGLSSALCIKQKIPTADVSVIADQFNEETTSFGAAGVFLAAPEDFRGIAEKRFRKWLDDGKKWYFKLASGSETMQSGVIFSHGYLLFNEELPPPGNMCQLPHYHKMTEEELDLIFSTKFKCGYFCTTVMIECKFYLPWLTKEFKKLGGKVIQRRISSFEELSNNYDIIVNCAGLANKWLLNDDKMVPIRGQVARVKMPWMKQWCYFKGRDQFTYVFAGQDSVVVGGCKQVGNDSLEISQEDSQHIFEKAIRLVPSVKDAEVKFEWVGLRPYREPLRLEKEFKMFGNKSIPMVHNYGHGSNGVALSWGTAVEVAQHVNDIIKTKKIPISRL